MRDQSRRLRIIVLLSGVTFLATVLRVYDASAESLTSRSCASANAQSSGTTAATSAHSSSQTVSGSTSGHRTGEADHGHSASPGGMSSQVETGRNRLSSTTRMPDGSTVTITSGQRSSSANVDPSGRARSNATGSAKSDDDCNDPGTGPSELKSRAGDQPTRK